MAAPLSLQAIKDNNISVGKHVNKIENQRLYETSVYTTQDEKRQTVLFWTPVIECAKKDDNHITLLLPPTDECEDFYNTLVHMDNQIINGANDSWKDWFPKDELTLEDVQDRFVSCIKAGTKEEQGRIMNLKTSSRIKCKVENTDEVTSDYSTLFNPKTRRGSGRILIELKRIIFGRGNFKTEYVAHQILLNEPEIEEPETQKFDNENWVDFE